MNQAVVGVAPHSLRAATPEELAAVAAMAPDGPIHIHVAEQVKEVEDCLAWSGARPVEWLLANAGVDERWCLIHATHMTDAETVGMAKSGAIAGLCPITEANLGDGTFAAPLFTEHGGRFGVGSDSNVLIGLPDELRQLEYSQRLAHRARNVLAVAGGSTGRALFDAALDGGSVALGAGPSRIAAGAAADFVSLDANHPSLAGKSGDAILDAWIFANGSKVDCVWVHGQKAGQRRPACQARGHRRALSPGDDGAFGMSMIRDSGGGRRRLAAPAHPVRHQRENHVRRLGARPSHPVRARADGRVQLLAHDGEQGAVAAGQGRADRAPPPFRQFCAPAAVAGGGAGNPRHQDRGRSAWPGLSL